MSVTIPISTFNVEKSLAHQLQQQRPTLTDGRRSNNTMTNHLLTGGQVSNNLWGCNSSVIICTFLGFWSLWVGVMVLIYLIPTLNPLLNSSTHSHEQFQPEIHDGPHHRHGLPGLNYDQHLAEHAAEFHALAHDGGIASAVAMPQQLPPKALKASTSIEYEEAYQAQAQHHSILEVDASIAPMTTPTSSSPPTATTDPLSQSLAPAPPSSSSYGSPQSPSSSSSLTPPTVGVTTPLVPKTTSLLSSSRSSPSSSYPSSTPFVRSPPPRRRAPTETVPQPSTAMRIYRMVKSKLKKFSDGGGGSSKEMASGSLGGALSQPATVAQHPSATKRLANTVQRSFHSVKSFVNSFTRRRTVPTSTSSPATASATQVTASFAPAASSPLASSPSSHMQSDATPAASGSKSPSVISGSVADIPSSAASSPTSSVGVTVPGKLRKSIIIARHR